MDQPIAAEHLAQSPPYPAMTLTHIGDDRPLTRRFRDGDEGALRELMGWYQRPATAMAYAMVRQNDDADDVVVKAFTRAWESRGNLLPGWPFWPWFCTILKNEARKWRHARQRWREVSADDAANASRLAANAARTTAFQEVDTDLGLRTALRRCLDHLDEPDRLVILLKRDGYLTDQQIAAALGCPVGTVKSRYSRARQRLKDLLAREYSDE